MIKFCVFGLFLLSLSCTPSSQDADFKVFVKSFHQSKWKQFPSWAVQAGHLKFVNSIPIPNQKKHESNLQFCKNYHDSLQSFDLKRLSKPLQFEYNKIQPFLTNYIHNFEVQKIHENDPTYYDLRSFFSTLKISNEQNFEVFENKLKTIPAYYSAAKQNLKSPDQEKLQQALAQQIQFYKILDVKLPKDTQTSKLTDNQKVKIKKLLFEAKLSVKDFIAFCESAAFENYDEILNAETSLPEGQGKKVLTSEN